jgi:hypothetical protein
MKLQLMRDGQSLDLDEGLQRALTSAVFDAERATRARGYHAHREGRFQAALEQGRRLERLRVLADFLSGAAGHDSF